MSGEIQTHDNRDQTIAELQEALSSRDATIETQGEEIAELRASVERLRGFLNSATEALASTSLAHDRWGQTIEICRAAVRNAALAPGAKGAKEVEQ